MKHKSIFIPILFLVFSMFCLAYASVPLYRIFCRATGYAGTVNRATPIQEKSLGKKSINISFNADISPRLSWSFRPELNNINVKTGEQKLVFYYAENLSNKSVEGMAVYNVTPNKAGKYFNKVACFCFTRQILLPYQRVVMPVSFFIDPEIEKDPETSNIDFITLSYTFFEAK